ncbi:MAG TPA: hypothetical protein DCF65_04045 [Chloroflexi bacterium]|nr:hypothetical protein [Chloroflexota bacterium]
MYASSAPLDIIERIRLAISAVLGAAIISTNGPSEIRTTTTKRTYKAMNDRERKSILPLKASTARTRRPPRSMTR